MEEITPKHSLVLCAIFLIITPSLLFAESFSFAVIGDTQDNYLRLGLIVTDILTKNVDLVLVCGDLAQNGTETQYQDWIDTAQPLYDAGIGVYPIRGNHDSIDSSAPNPKTAWDNKFSGPYALPANGPPGEENITFSFSNKNAFFCRS